MWWQFYNTFGLVLCLICVVDVFRRNKPFYWSFVILLPFWWGQMGIGLLGCVAYLVMEVWPDFKAGRLRAPVGGAKPTNERIKKLEEQAEYAPTVENQALLAEAYLESDHYEDAAATFEECLSGLYENDPHYLLGLAQAKFGLEQFEDALAALDRIDATGKKEKWPDRQVLRARCLEATDRSDDARTIYESIVETFTGDEVRYRLGKLYLDHEDKAEEGQRMLEEIIEDAKYLKGTIGKQQQFWVKLAKRALAG